MIVVIAAKATTYLELTKNSFFTGFVTFDRISEFFEETFPSGRSPVWNQSRSDGHLREELR